MRVIAMTSPNGIQRSLSSTKLDAKPNALEEEGSFSRPKPANGVDGPPGPFGRIKVRQGMRAMLAKNLLSCHDCQEFAKHIRLYSDNLNITYHVVEQMMTAGAEDT